jgi:hypothetical protein
MAFSTIISLCAQTGPKSSIRGVLNRAFFIAGRKRKINRLNYKP